MAGMSIKLDTANKNACKADTRFDESVLTIWMRSLLFLPTWKRYGWAKVLRKACALISEPKSAENRSWTRRLR